MEFLLFLSTPSARRATSQICSARSMIFYFYPRPPRGGRLGPFCGLGKADVFLSTPSARRATPFRPHLFHQNKISIHALREEGDRGNGGTACGSKNFYPRPPRGGRRALSSLMVRLTLFLSTPSARRATSSMAKILRSWLFLSTPSARRATTAPATDLIIGKFLSTPSARRATAKTETKSLFSYKLYNILHEFRRALIYNGSKNYPNHAK